MLLDYFIDDLIRLQTRHASLVWRLWENDGVNIEFFLEELALDCVEFLQKAGITAVYRAGAARVVHLPAQSILQDPPAVLQNLKRFLETT
jgi:hypothetical protein